MRVLIVGGGLIGVTAAYFLKRRGCDVTVVERQPGVARETSFANGGLLTASMAEPWNAPGCWRVLLSSLGRSDAALQLRLRALPSLMRWGIAFLRNSSPALFEHSANTNLRLALDSLAVMDSLRRETGIEYGHAARGSLRIFRDPDKLHRACAVAEQRAAQGLGFRMLSAAETAEVEPALAPIVGQLSGALHYQADQTGDAYQFCVALAEHARRQGVDFRFGAEISALELDSNRVTSVLLGQERLVADKYVIAAGSFSTQLLRQAGVALPMQPAKGYSITVQATSNDTALRIPVVDDELHAVIAPLGAAIRVAGTAEFAGFDPALPAARIHNLQRLLQAVLPQANFDRATLSQWCGLRAMSADGVPIVGATPVSNLFVSTGHGHLGWTLAAGSARLLADVMCGNATQSDTAPVALERFT